MLINTDKWKDWKWQLQNRIKSLEKLKSILVLSELEEKTFHQASEFFDFAVSPYYISLVDKNDPNCPIRKQIIPSNEELERSENERIDPLGEESYMPVYGVTHRYPDRALWYLSHVCAVYCRFCTRKRKVGKSESTPDTDQWKEALEYFQTHPEIKEVILSGGDPLSLSDDKLDYILTELKNISSINHIRIHSRYPVTLPYRITESLASIFSKHYPLFMVTHFNHSKEITDDTKERIELLIRKGNVILLNQTVLLKGINDSAKELQALNYKLVQNGIKPYYLHQCDEVFGSRGFKVPIEKGVSIMNELRGYMSGITVPLYVIDLTGGGGKVPLPTDYLIKEDAETYYFKNYKGNTHPISKVLE
jgi:lysine 2,3-aminomutase